MTMKNFGSAHTRLEAWVVDGLWISQDSKSCKLLNYNKVKNAYINRLRILTENSFSIVDLVHDRCLDVERGFEW